MICVGVGWETIARIQYFIILFRVFTSILIVGPQVIGAPIYSHGIRKFTSIFHNNRDYYLGAAKETRAI